MSGAHLTKLTGDAVARYVSAASTALRRARLNRQYPSGRATADHIGLMGPDCHQGLYPDLELDLRSGLPSYREWVRIQSDLEALSGWESRPLEELERKASADPGSVFGKQLLQHHYREHLKRKKTVDFDELSVQLIRILAEERAAEFCITMDKLSVAGTFSRTTIHLTQKEDSWNRDDLRLEGEQIRHTDGFRTLIYSMSNSGAEMLFNRLESDETLTVNQVTRGTIGPIFLPGSSVPEPLHSLVNDSKAFIASFSLDTASRQQKEDRHNDPLSAHLGRSAALLPQELLNTARSRHGYRVFRDRKFVTDAAHLNTLQSLCDALGTRNIVYKL